MTTSPILECRHLGKTFTSGAATLAVLKNASLTLARGERCAILGPSGSGKTTLLALCAGLDQPSTGEVRIEGASFSTLPEEARAALRRDRFGFVFQSFQLIPSLTALENVMVPLELQGKPARSAAAELLSRVGLEARGHHYPFQLSGGEQQRVALARAFINRPAILFADEPTGNLDRANADRALEVMLSLNEEIGTSILLVTHDESIAHRMHRTIRLRDGEVVS